MALNHLKFSSINRYRPNKVLSGQVTASEAMESWLYDDQLNDPWWQGASAAAYRFRLTINITAAPHSSHLTREPYVYNGLDVIPGMWVMSISEAKALRITKIISKTAFNITCIVEDVDRYNTFRDQTGAGSAMFQIPATIVLFELGDDGLPMFDPLPPDASDLSILHQVESRYRVFNPNTRYRFYQIDHDFMEGDIVRMDAIQKKFVKATSEDIYVSGTVVDTGPGPNYFYLSPSTKILENLEPGLPGDAGSVIWMEAETNHLTVTPHASRMPMYIQLTPRIPSFTIGNIIAPQIAAGTEIKINKVLVSFTDDVDGDGYFSTDEVINLINAKTEDHGVIASWGADATTIGGWENPPLTQSINLPHIEFKVNGVTVKVTRPSIQFGNGGLIGGWDFVRAINELTDVHDVTATFHPDGYLIFTNEKGGNIMFENVLPLVSNGMERTFTDAVGVSTENFGAEPTRLMLTRLDGGEISLSNVSGDFMYETGVQSTSNGKLPLALVVDQTIASTSSYVVTNLTARDALTGVRSGDQVFVQSGSTAGEWELYVKTGTTWTLIANYDSANTDANSLSVTIDVNSGAMVSLGTISSGSRIVDVAVVVEQAFDAVDAVLSVGPADQPSVVISSDNIDLTIAGSYETNSSFVHSGAGEAEIFVHFNKGMATVGSAKVIISYL